MSHSLEDILANTIYRCWVCGSPDGERGYHLGPKCPSLHGQCYLKVYEAIKPFFEAIKDDDDIPRTISLERGWNCVSIGLDVVRKKAMKKYGDVQFIDLLDGGEKEKVLTELFEKRAMKAVKDYLRDLAMRARL